MGGARSKPPALNPCPSSSCPLPAACTQVCRKVRELYPNSCMPVIMISAKNKEENIVEGLASGSNDYVSKPFGRQVGLGGRREALLIGSGPRRGGGGRGAER